LNFSGEACFQVYLTRLLEIAHFACFSLAESANCGLNITLTRAIISFVRRMHILDAYATLVDSASSENATMNVPVSIFLDFNLPNATTWFYFSFLLAMALFFKFSRLLSIRNWDVVMIFLLVPGLLMLQQSRGRAMTEDAATVAARAASAGIGTSAATQTGLTGMTQLAAAELAATEQGPGTWPGYVWLLVGSVYLLLRCLLDLVLVRRPALGPNLNSGGMAWLAGAMFICLAAVAFRPPERANLHAPAVQAELPAQSNETVGQPSAPVKLAQSQFDGSFILERTFAILCHLAVVIGLILVGRLHFQDTASGMAAATFYLLLPYTGYFVGQVHHVLPMALVVWSVVFYRQPTLAGIFLGLAAGTMFFPALIAPLWISFYWKRGAGRFAAFGAVAGALCLAVTGLVLWFTQDLGQVVAETMALSDWQPWNWKAPSHEGFWQGVHWAYRTPVFILYITLVIVTAIWPQPKNLAHVLALSAGVLIGVQLWYADQGGVYVLWYLPLVLLLMFRPNLSDRRPNVIQPDNDWLTAVLGWARNVFRRLFRAPNTLVRVR
jgi:hypothetical protein